MEIATTSAPFVPHLLQRKRLATASNVTDDPHNRASASGSATPSHRTYVICTRKWPKRR